MTHPSPQSAKRIFAFVLHAHLPYVHAIEGESLLEERWLFDALTDTYLPLIGVLNRLRRERISSRMTMAISPALLAMLEDPMLPGKYGRYLNNLEAAHKNEPQIAATPPEARPALAWRVFFDECGGRLIERLRDLQDDGVLEIATCTATHSMPPLLKRREAMRAQVAVAVGDYRRLFGRGPRGIWLPDCAYAARVDETLQQLKLQYVLVDTSPGASAGTAADELMRTPGGLVVYARNKTLSQNLWHGSAWGEGVCGGSGNGYTDLHNYMDHRKLPNNGSDCEIGSETGSIVAKHAEQFIVRLHEQYSQNPLFTATYDAGLFKHRWLGGAEWLESVFRLLHRDRNLECATYGELGRLLPIPSIESEPANSDGENGGGHLGLSVQPDNDWIYRHLHYAEDRLVGVIHPARAGRRDSGQVRLLNLAARQLLLAQSGDWPLLLTRRQESGYAGERILEHLTNVHRLLDMLPNACDGSEWLDKLERRWPCFPDLHYSVFLRKTDMSAAVVDEPIAEPQPYRNRDRGAALPSHHVLMLAWEYPPNVIGGLARAVCDLSRHLAALGHTVHVVTRHLDGLEKEQIEDGVHIHRVKLLQSWNSGLAFADWVFQMNLAFADYAHSLIGEGCRIDVIHAHDWLVGTAAEALKQRAGLPLVTTIHATEYGRSLGKLETELQRKIFRLEQRLTGISDRLIACSRSMVDEISRLFAPPTERIAMIPNGVDDSAATASDGATAAVDTVDEAAEPIERNDVAASTVAAVDADLQVAASGANGSTAVSSQAPSRPTALAATSGADVASNRSTDAREATVAGETTDPANGTAASNSTDSTDDKTGAFDASGGSANQAAVGASVSPTAAGSTDTTDTAIPGDPGAGTADADTAPAAPILFTIGRLVHEKGIHVLLAAMPAVLARFPQARLIIAGAGPMHGELEALARPLGAAVHFAGFVDGAAKWRLYRQAAASVFPSLYEPFGIVALEAMAAGSPVVAARTGGLTETIRHGSDGLLVRPGNADALAKAICKLLAEPALAARLVQHARRKIARQYGWTAIAASTAEVYTGCARKSIHHAAPSLAKDVTSCPDLSSSETANF